MTTDVKEFIGDLEAGGVEAVAARVLSAVAAATVDYQRKGKFSLTIEFERIGQSQQVLCKHTLSYKHPTKKGDIGESVTGETPMYVGKGGSMSLLQQDQGQLFTKKGDIT